MTLSFLYYIDDDIIIDHYNDNMLIIFRVINGDLLVIFHGDLTTILMVI